MNNSMKSKLFILGLLVTLFFLITIKSVQAENNFGAGVVIGDPTGLSFKYNLNENNSIDAALAWSSSVSILMQGDYLWNKPKLFFLDNYPVDLFFGAGARIRDYNKKKYNDDDRGFQFGVRAPVGLRFMFREPRIEIFTELAMVLNLIKSTSVDLDFGIGGRYFF